MIKSFPDFWYVDPFRGYLRSKSKVAVSLSHAWNELWSIQHTMIDQFIGRVKIVGDFLLNLPRASLRVALLSRNIVICCSAPVDTGGTASTERLHRLASIADLAAELLCCHSNSHASATKHDVWAVIDDVARHGTLTHQPAIDIYAVNHFILTCCRSEPLTQSVKALL